MALSLASNQLNFLRDGRPFFLLGDTCWSAFTHPTPEEWEDYLSYRQEQGFNALQMNILPQRHASLPKEWHHPFQLKDDGSYDFDYLNPAYFERAKTYLAAMREKKIIPMLILLWGNYVPGTWQQRLDAGRTSVLERPFSMVIPFEAMCRYVSYAVDCFKAYEPVFVISGDTDLVQEETCRYYEKALHLVKRSAPNCLTTLHLFPSTEIPPRLFNMTELDFYMFQPGHDSTRMDLNVKLSRKFSSMPVRRPAMNSETCYEGNSYFDHNYGRFTDREVRRAFWQSVLNGACAGFTYGAAGIWLWQRRNTPCSIELPLFPGSRWIDQCHDWRTDLELAGAWDVAYGKWLIETYGAWGLRRLEGIALPAEEAISAAANEDESLILVYTPCTTRLTLRKDLSGYDLQWIDLERRRNLQAIFRIENGETRLALPSGTGDCLLIAKRTSK